MCLKKIPPGPTQHLLPCPNPKHMPLDSSGTGMEPGESKGLSLSLCWQDCSSAPLISCFTLVWPFPASHTSLLGSNRQLKLSIANSSYDILISQKLQHFPHNVFLLLFCLCVWKKSKGYTGDLLSLHVTRTIKIVNTQLHWFSYFKNFLHPQSSECLSLNSDTTVLHPTATIQLVKFLQKIQKLYYAFINSCTQQILISIACTDCIYLSCAWQWVKYAAQIISYNLCSNA